jgi:hypothetical protein
MNDYYCTSKAEKAVIYLVLLVSAVSLFIRTVNTLGTMGSTSGPHYILTRKFIEKRFLFRFS